MQNLVAVSTTVGAWEILKHGALGPTPMTHRNLPSDLTCYHTKFGYSAATLPWVESSMNNTSAGSWGPKVQSFRSRPNLNAP